MPTATPLWTSVTAPRDRDNGLKSVLYFLIQVTIYLCAKLYPKPSRSFGMKEKQTFIHRCSQPFAFIILVRSKIRCYED